MQNKKGFDHQNSVYTFALSWIFCQTIFSGIDWLFSHQNIAITEILISMLLGIIFMFIEQHHERASWAYIVMAIMMLLLAMPLARANINSISQDSSFWIKFFILLSIILEWVITFYFSSKKNDLVTLLNQYSPQLDVNTGRWYHLISGNVQKISRDSNSSNWNLLRFIVPFGPALGLFLSRNPNKDFSAFIVIIMILFLAFVFSVLSAMSMAQAYKLITAEKALNKKITFYWHQ